MKDITYSILHTHANQISNLETFSIRTLCSQLTTRWSAFIFSCCTWFWPGKIAVLCVPFKLFHELWHRHALSSGSGISRVISLFSHCCGETVCNPQKWAWRTLHREGKGENPFSCLLRQTRYILELFSELRVPNEAAAMVRYLTWYFRSAVSLFTVSVLPHSV